MKKEVPIIYNFFYPLAGRIENWFHHIERIKYMNFNWIYFNPLHYPGRSKSLYSAKYYFRINPKLGSDWGKLKEFIEACHKNGIKVMHDLVINHTAIDNPLTKKNNVWYITDNKGKIKHPGCWNNGRWRAWKDLAWIDNKNSSDRKNLWAYWLKVINFYIDLGFDGFRCDAAYQIPSVLWKYIFKKIRKRNMTFFAETLGCTEKQTLETAKSGFDFIFNSSKYWNLSDSWCINQYNKLRKKTSSISFPESHDTARLFTESKGNENYVRMRYGFSALFSSGVLMPVGFEFGFKKRINVSRTTEKDWENINCNLIEYIKGFNLLKKKYRVFHEDNLLKIIPAGNKKILVIKKTSIDRKEKGLIIINKNCNKEQVLFLKYLPGKLTNITPGLPFEYILPKMDRIIIKPGQVRVFLI